MVKALNDVTLEREGEGGSTASVTLRFRFLNGFGDRYFYLPLIERNNFHMLGLNQAGKGRLLKNDVIAIGTKEVFVVYICPKCGKIMLYNPKSNGRQPEEWLCGLCETPQQGALVEPTAASQ